MASAYIVRYETGSGTRYRVRYRVGGADTKPKHAGSFRTQREARLRRDWVAGELAAMRVPDVRLVEQENAETLTVIAARWRTSRVDVSDGTAATHAVNLGRILPRLGTKAVDRITPADVARLVGELDAFLSAESVRKTLATLAMVLDFAGRRQDNPARDRVVVKLPRKDRTEVDPPLASHVLAVRAVLAPAYRLPIIVLDATGMRVGELEALTWGDVDEIGGRWRVSAAVSKTGRARWVPVEPAVFRAVVELAPREDRDVAGPVFAGFGADRFRTALTKACKHAGVPTFSPHDLRHRRATLWHLGGVPAAQAASWLGHSAQEHLRTYAHATLVDRSEIPYAELLERAETLRRARAMSHP